MVRLKKYFVFFNIISNIFFYFNFCSIFYFYYISLWQSTTNSSTKILIVNSMTNGALNSSGASAAIFNEDGNGPVSSKVYNPSNHIILENQFRECEKMYIKQCIQHYYQGRLSETDLTNLCFQELNRRFNVKDVSGEEMAAKHFVSMIYNFYLVEMVKMIITSRIRKPNFQFKVINVTKLLVLHFFFFFISKMIVL